MSVSVEALGSRRGSWLRLGGRSLAWRFLPRDTFRWTGILWAEHGAARRTRWRVCSSLWRNDTSDLLVDRNHAVVEMHPLPLWHAVRIDQGEFLDLTAGR